MGSSAFCATARSNSALASAVTTPPAAPCKRFAEIGTALGAVAGVSDEIAIGPDRVIVAAEPRQHRRQHGPAAAIGRILFQMRLDLRHHVVERLVGVRGAGARGQRKIAEPRRSEREVERDRRDRQPHQRHDRRRAAQAEVRPRRQVALAVRGGQQAAADFDARRLGLGYADQPGGDIAIDLGELVLVDRRPRCRRPAQQSRGSTARARRRSPRPSSARTQTTASSSGSRGNGAFRRAPMRRFTPPAASPAIDNCGRKHPDREPPEGQAGGGFEA